MSNDIQRFAFRLPADLHRRLAEAATANGRSLNAEMVTRLTESLDGPPLSAALRAKAPSGRTLEDELRDMRDGALRAAAYNEEADRLVEEAKQHMKVVDERMAAMERDMEELGKKFMEAVQEKHKRATKEAQAANRAARAAKKAKQG